MGAIWTEFTQGIFDYAFSAYDKLGVWTYPMILIAIIGYVYTFTQSVTVGIAAIIITFSIYGGSIIFAGVSDATTFLYIVTLIGICALIVTLFLKYVEK